MLSTYIDFNKENNDKDSEFKLVILLGYQNIKTFLLKVALQIGLKKFLRLKKLMINVVIIGNNLLLMTSS